MISNWRNQIDTIKAGEPVTAAVTNRPIIQIAQRTQHLRDRQDANDLAGAIRHIEAPLNSSTKAGEVVAYDSDNEEWVPALAEIIGSGSNAVVSDRAFVYGIVEVKHTPSSGDIVVGGVSSSIDVTSLVSTNSPLTYGQMYLSSSEPGKVQSNRPSLGIPVCYIDKDAIVLVRPILNELLDDHRHYRFELYSKPAAPIKLDYASNTLVGGEVVEFPAISGATAEVHSVDGTYLYLKNWSGPVPTAWESLVINDTAPTSSKTATTEASDARLTVWIEDDTDDHVELTGTSTDYKGWLPAAGMTGAPTGAKFGYNLTQHSDLNNVFPIAPNGGAVITINGQLVFSDQVKIDENGIWWMDDCADSLPWIYSDDANYPGWPSKPYVYDDCPAEYPIEVILWFTMMTSMTDQAVVTQLEPESGSFITVKNANGDDATRGHLFIGAEFNLTNPEEDASGFTVVKDIQGVAMTKGPVVEKLIAESPIVATSADGAPAGQGTVTLTLDDITGIRSGVPDLYYNDNTRLDNLQGLIYLAFPQLVNSGIRGRISVPLTLATGGVGIYDLKLVLQLLALHGTGASYTLPDLSVHARKVSYLEDGDAPVTVPSGLGEQTLPSVTFSTPMLGQQYIGKEIDFSAYFDLIPGDTFYFTIERSGESDGYAADLGMLSLQYVLTKTT